MENKPSYAAVTLAEFKSHLAQALEAQLRDCHSSLSQETIRVFDLGCFPWHGYLELSFLTDDEPRLTDKSNALSCVADWKLYNFAPRWARGHTLGKSMRACWHSAADKKAVADQYFRACAAAVCSSEVSGALGAYRRSRDFVVRVVDPDDSESPNYCLVRSA